MRDRVRLAYVIGRHAVWVIRRESDFGHCARGESGKPRDDGSPRGRWEVITADGRGRISCETLEDARRIAYLAVAHGKNCELIVRDAYNRIIEHELIERHQSGPTGS